eukprot:354873-Chlamydomonas_euryale.AAC.8
MLKRCSSCAAPIVLLLVDPLVAGKRPALAAAAHARCPDSTRTHPVFLSIHWWQGKDQRSPWQLTRAAPTAHAPIPSSCQSIGGRGTTSARCGSSSALPRQHAHPSRLLVNPLVAGERPALATRHVDHLNGAQVPCRKHALTGRANADLSGRSEGNGENGEDGGSRVVQTCGAGGKARERRKEQWLACWWMSMGVDGREWMGVGVNRCGWTGGGRAVEK